MSGTSLDGVDASIIFSDGEKKIRAYIGFDCTAQSLHVGNLLQIIFMGILHLLMA